MKCVTTLAFAPWGSFIFLLLECGLMELGDGKGEKDYTMETCFHGRSVSTGVLIVTLASEIKDLMM